MYSPFKMKGKSPMMKALIGKQNNLPAGLKAKIEASPARKDKKYDKATMKSVTGDKWDDKHKNKQSEMSYTDDFANKSFKDLKSNYTTGKTYKQKDRENNYENADVVRAYRDQQKNVKKGMDSLGNPIKMKKASPTKMKKASPSKMKKKSPAKADNINSSGTNKKNVKKIQEGIKGKTDKEKKGIVERNLANYHFKNSIPSAGADSVQAVLNTYLEEKNAPTKMKKKSSMKMMKKKSSIAKNKGDMKKIKTLPAKPLPNSTTKREETYYKQNMKLKN